MMLTAGPPAQFFPALSQSMADGIANYHRMERDLVGKLETAEMEYLGEMSKRPLVKGTNHWSTLAHIRTDARPTYFEAYGHFGNTLNTKLMDPALFHTLNSLTATHAQDMSQQYQHRDAGENFRNLHAESAYLFHDNVVKPDPRAMKQEPDATLDPENADETVECVISYGTTSVRNKNGTYCWTVYVRTQCQHPVVSQVVFSTPVQDQVKVTSPPFQFSYNNSPSSDHRRPITIIVHFTDANEPPLILQHHLALRQSGIKLAADPAIFLNGGAQQATHQALNAALRAGKAPLDKKQLESLVVVEQFTIVKVAKGVRAPTPPPPSQDTKRPPPRTRLTSTALANPGILPTANADLQPLMVTGFTFGDPAPTVSPSVTPPPEPVTPPMVAIKPELAPECVPPIVVSNCCDGGELEEPAGMKF
eukprot:TRINITY_DN66845_c4_g1_i1.p1 TRINITY_DN66845_c4_g1~~TRINITY_DN66845_c4_g1_i1.p1  ORF type:complete len:420 (-),score=41.86 TRINITY_DN66845_c4_g1_i1:703-1962(-)